jgi:hypothetical protein
VTAGIAGSRGVRGLVAGGGADAVATTGGLFALRVVVPARAATGFVGTAAADADVGLAGERVGSVRPAARSTGSDVLDSTACVAALASSCGWGSAAGALAGSGGASPGVGGSGGGGSLGGDPPADPGAEGAGATGAGAATGGVATGGVTEAAAGASGAEPGRTGTEPASPAGAPGRDGRNDTGST